ncbi:MAG TPA: hypothetical protein VGM09_28620 [Bradyrhizobium sp.]|jgi:hypothetical protein
MNHDQTLDNELTVNELDAVAGGGMHQAFFFIRQRIERSLAARSPSIVNTSDDTPLNYLGLFNSNG